jgi:glycosyltransferase involved in cell wall biosynthesis
VRVTIVVPVYNQSEYLSECLASVVAQTAAAWETVVVDDASTHGDVAAVVRAIGDGRIRSVRHATNRGLAAARNTGIREARGELVLPLDADDKLASTFLAETIEALERKQPCDAVFSDFMAFGARHGVIRFAIRDVQALLKEQWIPGSGTLCRRTLWEKAGGYCEADALRPGNEDWDYWISAAEHGLQVAHVAKPLYLYRQHAESMVTRLQIDDHRTRLFIYERHSALFDRFGMKNAFLSGGYLSSAKAHWRRRKAAEALRLALQSWTLAPAECTQTLARQAWSWLLRQGRLRRVTGAL